MQKKLIALAVAGLASTAAFAQTNVQIYGSLDYGYSYRFDDRTLDARLPAGTGKSSSRFDGGQSAGSCCRPALLGWRDFDALAGCNVFGHGGAWRLVDRRCVHRCR